ncbi:MAG: 3'(2'),5'-bisphosphate nucleotidase CysQ, partial [Bacteroidia bacterium]|nr:3'(2'),5'-bisphosphate nucleotidase CysQ [Bacteroidia bacterium]
MKDITRLLPLVIDTALKAGKEIMEVYQTTFKVELKDDRTPLTLADKKSHEVIEANLSAYFPLLSEEGKSVPFEERLNWERFWMVDPLDGTKEFLKRNNEFTVNIALIENGIPVMGVVYAPALNRFYYAEKQTGSFRFIWQGAETPDVNAILSKAVKLPLELS